MTVMHTSYLVVHFFWGSSSSVLLLFNTLQCVRGTSWKWWPQSMMPSDTGTLCLSLLIIPIHPPSLCIKCSWSLARILSGGPSHSLMQKLCSFANACNYFLDWKSTWHWSTQNRPPLNQNAETTLNLNAELKQEKPCENWSNIWQKILTCNIKHTCEWKKL